MEANPLFRQEFVDYLVSLSHMSFSPSEDFNYYLVIQIMWKRLYTAASSNEGGTLMHLRNVINRRNVGIGKDVKAHVNEIEDFLVLVITCHLLAATMHFFGMKSLEDTPHNNTFPLEVDHDLHIYPKKALSTENGQDHRQIRNVKGTNERPRNR